MHRRPSPARLRMLYHERVWRGSLHGQGGAVSLAWGTAAWGGLRGGRCELWGENRRRWARHLRGGRGGQMDAGQDGTTMRTRAHP